MKNHAIKTKGLVVRFDETLVFQNVDLEILTGECFVLVGPSGQGKTTLLKTLAGLIPPQSGEVLMKDKNIYAVDEKQRLALMQRAGMLFQKNALFDSWTCGENIAFPLREATDLAELEIQKKVEHFLEAVGLSPARDLFPEEISGGMQKRLGIARALALRPEIIFYDDPTAGLDPITSRKIVQLILQLHEQDHSTVIAVTNDMNRAYQMADRIGFVDGGKVLVTGTVEETKAHKDPRVQQFIRGALEGPLTQP